MANFCRHPRHWEAITEISIPASQSKTIGLWGFKDYEGNELQLDPLSPYLKATKGPIVGYDGSGEDHGKLWVRVYSLFSSGLPSGSETLVARSRTFGEWCRLKVTVIQPSEWSGDSSMWPQDKKIRSMDADLRGRVAKVLSGLRDRGFQPKIVYGWRSVAVQQELFRLGRTKVKFSFHNAQKPDGTPNAYAADIVDERWGWSPSAESNGFWDALGEEAHDARLVWGGDWTSFPDRAHVQNKANSELSIVKRASGL